MQTQHPDDDLSVCPKIIRCKVDRPKSNIAIISTPTFEWCVIRTDVDVRTDSNKRHVFKIELNYVLILC